VKLQWRQQPDTGELLARTILFHSNEPYFRQRLPMSIGLIRLDCGPSVVAHLQGGSLMNPGRPVRLALRLDRAGGAVLVAFPREEVIDVVEDVKSKKVLVTDAGSEIGMALVHALAAAGAGTIWAGSADRALSFPNLGNVAPLSLDLTSDASVAAAAASVGSEVDILINTAARRVENAAGAISRAPGAPTLESARLDIELYYFGLMRLAREFGPRMRARNTGNTLPAVAWVNLLSIQALTGSPSQAAAHSFSQSLRAQMLSTGIRVVNVFAGPMEQGPESLADEIVTAIRSGVEDVYAGDVAKHLFALWRDNPKALERELARASS
jgi:NAD(P)-dependent dehydrogenase (short-subunit alcohol dehydrogenase family)